MSEQEWLSIAEAAAVWRVSKITVHRWIKQGRVQAYRVGPRKVRLRADDVDALPVPVQEHPRAEEGEMLIMSDEQAKELRDIYRSIDENAARIRARSGLHESAAPLIRKMREERDEYLRQVWEESNEELRRRRRAPGDR